MNTKNLREELTELEDVRRGARQRHKIDVVLMITILATMSGYMGYRAIGDFAKRYKEELIEHCCFIPKLLITQKYYLPSYE